MFVTILRSLLLTCSLALLSTAWAGEALWIDVRTAEEFAAGHVEGAVNIPYEEIVARIGEVTDDKTSLVYLYCRSGRRSGIALEALQEAGFTRAVNIGGLEDAKREATADAKTP